MYSQLKDEVKFLEHQLPGSLELKESYILFPGNLHPRRRIGLIFLLAFTAGLLALVLFMFISIGVFTGKGFLVLFIGLSVISLLMGPIIGKTGELDWDKQEYRINYFGKTFRRISLREVSKIQQTTHYYNGFYQGVSIDLIMPWGRPKTMMQVHSQEMAGRFANIAAFMLARAKGLG